MTDKERLLKLQKLLDISEAQKARLREEVQKLRDYIKKELTKKKGFFSFLSRNQ